MALSLHVAGNPSPSPAAHINLDRARIEADLRKLVKGEVYFDRHHRLLYSTDASIYQQEPVGVVMPADAHDIQQVLAYCAAAGIGVLPRGGGTSLAGQCTNFAVVVDTSKHMRRVLEIDPQQRRCRVQPGITLEELNLRLAKGNTGLLFAPDPATVAQATVGGCIGNNAAGARSIVYGRTSENVSAVDVVLTTGHRTVLTHGAGRRDKTALRLALGVAEICSRYAEPIRQRFPRTLRRNAGYGLDLIRKQLDRGVEIEDLDLSGLVCGAEGTLAAVVEATLKLHPVPTHKGLAVVSFASVEAAMDSLAGILSTLPCAVELLDDVVLEAAAGNSICRAYVDLLPRVMGDRPRAVLYVEYQSSIGSAEIQDRFDALQSKVGVASIAEYRDAASMSAAWALRKAGEPLLHGLPGRRKPHTFVEDNAIPVENLPRFVREFKAIVARHGTEAAYYAHASVGVLHVRPLIDLHDPADRARMRAIAVEVADLARECGGVMSGEHGDGKVRGPLLERYFGPEIMAAFREVKALFDPAGILNPGNITAPGPVESITSGLRIDAAHATRADPAAIDTYYTYTDQEDFGHALEQCNGAGVCRKTAGGTMCPSYRATLDERHSTRGRGNALRTAVTGQSSPDGKPDFSDPGTIETLDLCLACKACKSECPSNVDIARLKAEYTAQRYRAAGRAPLRARVFGHVRTLNRLGAMAPAMANFANRLPPVRFILNRVLGVAPQRSLPAFATSLYKWFERRSPAQGRPQSEMAHTPANDASVRPRVVLYADCFTTYNDPHIGKAAVRVLEALGYEVLLPRVDCCGRAMMSTGLLADAITSADRTLSALRPFIDDPSVRAFVVCEPSCLASIKDDWLLLKLATPLDIRQAIAGRSSLVEEFVSKNWETHPTRPPLRPIDRPIHLHGHCHQKALWGDATSSDALRRVSADPTRVHTLPSGCCGMAGSFGYDAKKYDVSMQIGELSVFPPLRAAGDDALIAAPGTSCRHQIHDGTGKAALHPIEIIAQAIAPA